MSAFALGGCNSAGTSSTTPASATCGLPAGITQIALVYPGNGSTGITSNPGQVIIASNGTFPINASWGPQFVPHGTVVTSTSLFGGSFTAALSPPFPNPNTPATFASPTNQSANVPNGLLKSGTVYDVYANDASSFCVPSQLFGTFTTL